MGYASDGLNGENKANLDRGMSDHACVFITASEQGLSPLPKSLLITKGLTAKAKSNHIIIRYPHLKLPKTPINKIRSLHIFHFWGRGIQLFLYFFLFLVLVFYFLLVFLFSSVRLCATVVFFRYKISEQ